MVAPSAVMLLHQQAPFQLRQESVVALWLILRQSKCLRPSTGHLPDQRGYLQEYLVFSQLPLATQK